MACRSHAASGSACSFWVRACVYSVINLNRPPSRLAQRFAVIVAEQLAALKLGALN